MHARLYAMPQEVRESRIKEALELVELTNRANSYVKTYSGGMRRRLELARGLLHRPKVMFLDEPTLGLDPQTREHIWTFIRKLAKEEKMTILITTHYMEEADSLCTRIGIIDAGKIRALGTPAQLKKQVGGDLVVIRQKNFNPKCIKGLKFVTKVSQEGPEVILGVKDAADNLQKLLAKIGPIESVEVREVSLTDVFLKYTGKKFRDEEEGGEGDWSDRVMHESNVRD
jgi:ABC-2 type transport system ATP-binding protein